MNQEQITEIWNRAKGEEDTPGLLIHADDHEQVVSVQATGKIFIRRKNSETQELSAWEELSSNALHLMMECRVDGKANIRSLVKNLPKDPENPGWVLGWAIVRIAPWQFVDIYASREAAEAEASTKGADFSIVYGSHQVGTDNFVGGLTPPSA